LATLIISAAGLLVAFVVLAAVAFFVLFNDDRKETRGDDRTAKGNAISIPSSSVGRLASGPFKEDQRSEGQTDEA
jgi:hypothetical protein